MTVGENEHLRARAAMRAERDAFFVASVLASYRDLMEIDGVALAAFLGCTTAALDRLALCRRPDGDGASFRDEVERIALYAGCDAGRLARVLRAASAAERMRTAAPGALLAARDRTSEEPAAHDQTAEPEPTSDAEGVEP